MKKVLIFLSVIAILFMIAPANLSAQSDNDFDKLRKELKNKIDEQLDKMKKKMKEAIDELFKKYLKPGEKPQVEPAGKPWLGFSGKTHGIEKGVEITKIFENSPAHRTGLKVGDIIVKMGSIEITKRNDLHTFLGEYKSGKTIEIGIIRNDKAQKLEMKLLTKALEAGTLKVPAPSIRSQISRSP